MEPEEIVEETKPVEAAQTIHKETEEEAKVRIQQDLVIKAIALQIRNTHIPKAIRKGKSFEEIQALRKDIFAGKVVL
jgi:hypothetical protein